MDWYDLFNEMKSLDLEGAMIESACNQEQEVAVGE